MKKHELEAYAKSFLIFFLSLELLIGLIIFLVYQDQKEGIKSRLFLEMKSFSYTLKGEAFDVEIAADGEETFVLHRDASSYYAYFPIPNTKEFVLRIAYPMQMAAASFEAARHRLFLIFGAISVVVALFSFAYSYYALLPLRRALSMSEEFAKDMIHDLNTPVTAMLLNIRMLRRAFDQKRLERLEQSARTISSLHTNLAAFLNDLPSQKETVDIAPLVKERSDYFASLYPALTFINDIHPFEFRTNADAFVRIVDNILSNACKYNKEAGDVRVTLAEGRLLVCDTGIGIKAPGRVFERFYKEGERGLGIGLHIVKKLCDQMGIAVAVDSSESGTCFTLTFN